MKRKLKKDSNLDIGYYVVAFIDLLGQQEYLRELKRLPNKQNPSETEAFVRSLKQTYGVVTGMRNTFSNFFDGYSRHKSDITQLSKEQRIQYNELASNPIKFQRFSDAMIIYLSVATQQYKLPTAGIFGILGAAASSFLCGLAAGHPLRGGIELGVGMEMTKGEIYGGALAKAYSLESKIANYPRIVIGPELISYLQMTVKQEAIDIYSTAGRQMAECCLEMIVVDDDGHAILDYLGEGFKKHIAMELDIEVIRRAHNHVLTSSERFRREKNSKLAFRYALLRSYFEEHLPIWVQKSSSTQPDGCPRETT